MFSLLRMLFLCDDDNDHERYMTKDGFGDKLTTIPNIFPKFSTFSIFAVSTEFIGEMFYFQATFWDYCWISIKSKLFFL